MAVMTAASPMTTPISVRTLRSLCAQRLEAEVTTASEKFIVLGELNRIGVDVDTSAMKGSHPVVRHTPHDQIDVFLRAGSLFLRPRTVPRYPCR